MICYMKKTILILAVCFTFFSCGKLEYIDPEVKFFIDGKEITEDSYSVPLNSYQEVRIESYAPKNLYNYFWRKSTEYPIDLREDREHLAILYSTGGVVQIEDGKYGSKELAEFRMMFSDSICQSGDHFILRVLIDDNYERTLRFFVE